MISFLSWHLIGSSGFCMRAYVCFRLLSFVCMWKGLFNVAWFTTESISTSSLRVTCHRLKHSIWTSIACVYLGKTWSHKARAIHIDTSHHIKLDLEMLNHRIFGVCVCFNSFTWEPFSATIITHREVIFEFNSIHTLCNLRWTWTGRCVSVYWTAAIYLCIHSKSVYKCIYFIV